MAERKSKKANPAARPAAVPADGDGQGAARRGSAAKPMAMRSMPESLPAEAAVLGSMIVDPRCIGDVVEMLDRNAFYHSEHQMLYDAIVSLYEKNRGEGIDGVLVRNELERRNQMEAIGGIEYLQRVIETVPSSANVQYYAGIVREKMLLRETIAAASDILNNAYDESGDASEKLDEAERKIFAVTDKRITSSAVALKDLVTRAYELIEKREGTHVTGLGTGYYELDDTTCGLQDGEMIIVAGRPSMGKAQPLDARVLTLAGWKQMGDLRRGEELASPDGAPSFVTGIYPRGRRQVYRITFADGRSTECCAEHLWRVNYRAWKQPRVLSTQRLIEMLGRKRYINRLWIDTFAGEFGDDADLPLDPWLLGFLLGDGTLGGSSVRFATADTEMRARVQEVAGHQFAVTWAGKYDYRLTQAGGAHAAGVQGIKPNPVKTALQSLGLWEITAADKHIPAIYRMASRASRTRLLCGLLDTDGWVEKWGSLRFATVSERLARDVVDLMRSLGGTGSYSAQRATYTYRGDRHTGQTAFVCNLQHRDGALFVELSHKKARLATGRRRQRRLNILSIDPTRVAPTQCIAVTHPSRLYVTDDFILTHNTALALNIAEHIGIVDKTPLAIFSLEMGRQQLAERFLCSYSGVDAQLVRKGMLSTEHYQKLVEACGVISEAPIYIDDTSALTPLELRAKARRLKSSYGIRCIVLDYLQLMALGAMRVESRQQEISTISRYLKSLARELSIPVVVLSQLNRSPEGREGHRPRMSDLRESGCLAGDSLVTLADTGQRMPIRELPGRKGFSVWSLNLETLKLEPAEVTNAFSTGTKRVFRLTTRLGRSIRATANHRFFTLDGWLRLDELHCGTRIALPRQITCAAYCSEVLTLDQAALLGHLIGDGCTLPRHTIQYTTRERDLAEKVAELAQAIFGGTLFPRIVKERRWYQVYLASSVRLTHGKQNPVARWLRRLGIFGLRSYEKRVPDLLFCQKPEIIACFLRHLWATDGCVHAPRGSTRHPQIYYASSSEQLARDVQALLLRLGINAIFTTSPQGTKGRMQFHIRVTGREDILRFAEQIGAVGDYKTESLQTSVAWVSSRHANTNRDVVPQQIWRQNVVPAMQRHGVSMRAMQAGIGTAFCGSTLYKTGVSRQRLARVAEVVPDPLLRVLAESHVYWDQVVSVEPDGEEQVYDLTVQRHANFLANDMVVHNSIEQDADVVMLLHREDYYHRGEDGYEPDNTAEVIIAKQRNGPTGTVKLTFMEKCTRFENQSIAPAGQDAVPF